MNCWMQEPHVMGLLLAPKERPQRTFMQKFLEGMYCRLLVLIEGADLINVLSVYTGRDEDMVLPAATGSLRKDIVL